MCVFFSIFLPFSVVLFPFAGARLLRIGQFYVLCKDYQMVEKFSSSLLINKNIFQITCLLLIFFFYILTRTKITKHNKKGSCSAGGIGFSICSLPCPIPITQSRKIIFPFSAFVTRKKPDSQIPFCLELSPFSQFGLWIFSPFPLSPLLLAMQVRQKPRTP